MSPEEIRYRFAAGELTLNEAADLMLPKQAASPRLAVLALFFSGCFACTPPTPPVYVVPVDAADGAPSPLPIIDTPCSAACSAMARVCGSQDQDCVRTMSHIDSSGAIREPNGKPLTCNDVAAAKTPEDMSALGVYCK